MKSLNKAIDILEVLLNNEDEMALADIALKSGYNKTTVSRIVSTLVKRGYLKQREKRGKYSLGVVFLNYSGVIKGRIKLRDVAIPHLIKLSRLVGESVILAVWDGKEAVLTETVHPPGDTYRPLKVVPDEGTRSPLHCTSVGKIILASMDREDLNRYFKNRTRERFTPNTITDVSAMERHLLQVRKEGIAYDDEEYTLGVRGVSAGLRNGEGNTVGAIGVLGPSVRLTSAAMRELSPAVKDCALKISKDLGYQGVMN